MLAIIIYSATSLHAQEKDRWIAPEGFILNYRTLNWNDFQGKEDKAHAEKLAERNVMALAYVSPAIYFTVDSGEVTDNGRVKFKFHVKCAFQSRAFAREATKKEHSNYVLIHEQDHYDIALNYANILQATLSGRDYSKEKFSDEIDQVGEDLLKRYRRTQETYDHEVNPDGIDNKEKQYLWDMRIKKCLENTTEEYYTSPENNVQTVKVPGQIVKRITGEPALQFAVRARPLYMEFPQEMRPLLLETKEWTHEFSILAFYTQKYYVQEDGSLPHDNFRTLAYMFIPNGKDTYKRVLIDTFTNEGKQVKITGAFFANADSDQVKELVITATGTSNDKGVNGTLYINRVYDNIPRLLPGKLKRLDEVAAKIEGGFEGSKAGATSKVKFKNANEITEALRKMGYN